MTTRWCAEISSNHNTSIDRCFRLIDAAAKIGCSSVKAQIFRVDDLFHSSILVARPELLERKSWELPAEFLKPMSERCKQHGMEFGCTPFSIDLVPLVAETCNWIKIASYEILWLDFLRVVGSIKMPVVLSTGMAWLWEVSKAIHTLQDAGCEDLTLLHCISHYPAPLGQCNLRAIESLRRTFHLPVGWSDHSVDPSIVLRAALKWDASIIEFHLDLDGAGAEYSIGHCWTPNLIGPVIKMVKDAECSDGDGMKIPQEAERVERDYRADPSDGLRPLIGIRKQFRDD